MSIQYTYPEYKSDLTEEMVEQCCDVGLRIAHECGLTVRHDKFLDAVRGKPGVRVEGDKVFFDREILRNNLEKYRAKLRENLMKESEPPAEQEWSMSAGGFSMMVLDIETEEPRMATSRDLRDLIHLINSFGIGGNYPVMPQDLPPLMRALACFKICWETADNMRPYDYLHHDQIPFLYEMHKVMDKPFFVTLTVAQSMLLDEKDVDIFLDFHPRWKAGEDVRFHVLDYPMMGITKPVTLTGGIAMYVAETVSVHSLFNAYDSDLEIPISVRGGMITDLRNACWAWGHPRQHLFKFLNSGIAYRLARLDRKSYRDAGTILQTSSSQIDEQCGMEKMATALMAAMQGGRTFSQLGSMCVDDLFSATQLVIDVEIVNYVKELIEAFDPHPDMTSMDGLYENLKAVCDGEDEFISSYDTVSKFRNIMPSSNRVVREKLRSWMEHRKILKDRAREEAIERINSFEQTFHLPEDKQNALNDIYARAEKELGHR